MDSFDLPKIYQFVQNQETDTWGVGSSLICYLTVPRPIWGIIKGIALITTLFNYNAKVTWSLITRLGP